MFITSFMNCLTCIAACLRVHYLISQSACQKMMKYCKWLIISKSFSLGQFSDLWKLGNWCGIIPQKVGEWLQIPHFPTSSDAVLLHLVIQSLSIYGEQLCSLALVSS